MRNMKQVMECMHGIHSVHTCNGSILKKRSTHLMKG